MAPAALPTLPRLSGGCQGPIRRAGPTLGTCHANSRPRVPKELGIRPTAASACQVQLSRGPWLSGSGHMGVPPRCPSPPLSLSAHGCPPRPPPLPIFSPDSRGPPAPGARGPCPLAVSPHSRAQANLSTGTSARFAGSGQSPSLPPWVRAITAGQGGGLLPCGGPV